MNKPIGSVSLDLDNQWSYLKVHGDKSWKTFPSYLDTFIPHVLKVLDDLQLNITFFVVGQDAALDKNKEYLQAIVDRGHEIGNHSFHHTSWLYAYTREELVAEISLAEAHIERVTGQHPTGFRSPGYSWGPLVLEVLQERGYRYDASTLPTYLGPLARWYYFWTAKLTKEEREERKALFGSFKDGLRPIDPYFWKLSNEETLLEIPVTTIPGIKTPFHFSYLMYLSEISMGLMNAYLNLAIQLCKLHGTQPSYLLHPLDLIGGGQVPALKFFPGMRTSSTRKVEIFIDVMDKLGKHFQLGSMGMHAEHVYADKRLPNIAVSF